jgi:hypothetical protein
MAAVAVAIRTVGSFDRAGLVDRGIGIWSRQWIADVARD